MRQLLFVGLLVLSIGSPAFAQTATADAEPAASEIRDLDAVVVTGVQPGPGMWKVSKGDHVMWVMGTLSPLPRKMTWRSQDAVEVIAQSQEVLDLPYATIDADVGFFRGLTLLPSLLGARKNPDNATLRDVLPADLYARWKVLKEKYIGRDSSVEKWRPIFAAYELYSAALGKSGLSDSGVVSATVRKAAKKHEVKLTRPMVKMMVADPKAAIRDFRAAPLNDVECFRKTLDRLETDLASMTARANAWAVGDLEALRSLPYSNQFETCWKALTEASFARKRGLDDAEQRVRQAWFDAAEKALANNQTTFAVLPITQLLKPDSYLAGLQAEGYSVEAP
ncbi:MAG TPA: TraB/GumN family protein [Lysobacter sp.]